MTSDRRLCIFFEAGGTRYAVEAVEILEVAEPDPGGETLHGHHGLRDLSSLLGGDPEERPGTAIVLDTSPTQAVRVAKVAGVFDAGRSHLPLPNRLIPLLTPAVRGALLLGTQLYFELDTAGVVRGLPRQTRRREALTRVTAAACLVFESGGARFGVQLARVKQVIAASGLFNRAPGHGGECLGVTVHEGRLYPVFSVSELTEPEGLIILLDVGDEPLALSASRAHGVKAGGSLGGLPILDVERMFS